MQAGVTRSEARELRRYSKFYSTYPSIRESLYPESGVAPGELLSRISFSHIAELLQCEDETKRTFYEIECIQGNWSVRELKLAEFSRENIGQLNTYVSWYRKCMMREDDNPSIGILLCTHKNHSLVEFALAGIDNQLFVSKYLLELPKKEEMQRFIEEQLAAGDGGNRGWLKTRGIESSDDEGGN